MEIVRILLLSLLILAAKAEFPRECRCPHRCICSLAIGKIDCTDANLQYVPTEINTCSWPGIRTVDLSGNRIRFVHELAFSRLENITRLYLYNNIIDEVDRSAFIGLKSLEYLYLDGNRLTELSHLVFWPLTRLRRLLLYNNALTSLPIHIFRFQKKLELLSLSDNRLSHLHVLIFRDIPQLKHLYLHKNRITDLSHGPFRELRQLQTLFLNNNLLATLTRFDFLGLNRLVRLRLQENLISSIQDETFTPTLSLEILRLEKNRLTSINVLQFAGPVKLTNLSIHSNKISKISNGAFYRLSKLRELVLSNNQLGQITTQTFVGLDSIRSLYLSNNRIPYIMNDSFYQCTKLIFLFLSNNELSCIEGGAFRNLSNLEYLDLGSNRLSYLPDELFSYLSKLQYLLLIFNNLRTIENTPFRNLRNLVQLSIFGNLIEYMAEGNLDRSDGLIYLEWDRTDIQEEGTLTCDCSSLWLHRWLASRRVHTTIRCAGPREFANRDIRSLSAESFICVDKKVSFHSECTNHVVSDGGCLRLTCSSAPRGPVSWSRVDGRPLRTVPESCAFTSPCAQGSRGNGVLVVEEVGTQDAGYYLCSASFENTVVSNVCRVVIGAPPTIDNHVSDISLPHPGGVVKFPLNISGDPQPTVTWEKFGADASGSSWVLSGNSSFPRHVISREGDLVIMDTTSEDEGLYQVTVRNGAGFVKANTTLSFVSRTSCGSRCENNGTCRIASYCECPSSYGGLHCEQFVGPSDVTTLPPTSSTTEATPTNLAGTPSFTSTPTEPATTSSSTNTAATPTPDPLPTEAPTQSAREATSRVIYTQAPTLPMREATPDVVHIETERVPDASSGSGDDSESGDGSRLGSSSGHGGDIPGSGDSIRSGDVSTSGDGSGSGDYRGSGSGVTRCSKGQLCDTDGLEDDEDYAKAKRQRRAAFYASLHTHEKKWRQFEAELKFIKRSRKNMLRPLFRKKLMNRRRLQKSRIA